MTVEEILAGTSTGRRQAVGQMEVIPILGDDDDTWAPPEVEVGTSDYGTVNLRNAQDRPTIVPPGAGWVVKEAAQDHAIGGGALIGAGKEKLIDTAMCIQETQGGLISKADHEMLILPLALRPIALAKRKEKQYSKLWDAIGEFNSKLGSRGRGSHLEHFLKSFAKEMDEFVAQFELVPNQLGAIILVNGKLAGVERAPSAAYWAKVWEPLIRICYGSLAIRAKDAKNPPPTRVVMASGAQTLEELRANLDAASAKDTAVTTDIVDKAKALQLQATAAEGRLATARGEALLKTVASPELAGQYVEVEHAIPYASLCAAAS